MNLIIEEKDRGGRGWRGTVMDVLSAVILKMKEEAREDLKEEAKGTEEENQEKEEKEE